MKVSKFGGSALADVNQITKVLSIIRSDSQRTCVVVSAPGRRYPDDPKITDLFGIWHRQRELRLSSLEVQNTIADRYREIVHGLGLEFDIESELEEIARQIEGEATLDYARSRGAYLIGRILAVALGYHFEDPAFCDWLGKYNKADIPLQEDLRARNMVIPGSYASRKDGSVVGLPEGGADTVGALVARVISADVFEKWMDVPLLMADPHVVEKPKGIEILTYQELRELFYMGNVFDGEAARLLEEARIPTKIYSINDPNGLSTEVIVRGTWVKRQNVITGIAGRRGYTVIIIEKRKMHEQVGFVRRILTALEANDISFEHIPSGIDTLSVIIDKWKLVGKHQKVIDEIDSICSPDTIATYPDMAIVTVVGQAMVRTKGVAAKIFSAIAEKEINIRMINQGSSEISIMVGVEDSDYAETIRAIYGAFIT
ncbi:MAG: ACT domain-containing protein [Gammaproteobacteria bacterium]